MSRSTALAFIVGAAMGSVATWLAVREYYSQIAEEEIQGFKDFYSHKYEESKEKDSDEAAKVEDDAARNAEDAREKPSIMEYAAQLQKAGYTNYSNVEGKPAKEEKVERPYVIAPDEFGEIEGYEQISLTYYDDQVVADENDELVDDVEDAIGFDSLATFGKYEDDSVFVRNDARKCDFEILKDYRKYSDVVKTKPHLTEV